MIIKSFHYRKCDSRCYDAKNSLCTCICGGINHGVGLSKAVNNTEEIPQKMLDILQVRRKEVKMDASDYQQLTSRTLISQPRFKLTDEEIMIIWNTIGIAGESGELSESIKHGIFHQHGLNIENIEEEIGDLLWYIAALCTKLNLDLSKIMKQNIYKLQKRYPNGYSVEDSKKRMDKEQ